MVRSLVEDSDLFEALNYIEQLMRESERLRERSVQITDLSNVVTMPPATVRRAAAELAGGTTERSARAKEDEREADKAQEEPPDAVPRYVRCNA